MVAYIEKAAKALADCCCDIKELTRSENSATRQLLQTQALDDANRRTTELQNENNLLRFAGMSGGGNPNRP